MPLPKNQRVYIINNPNLIIKWDFEKNEKNGLDPSKLTEGSHMCADFICQKCGNKWNGVIRHFKNSQYCEECIRTEAQNNRRRKEIESKGSLLALFPDIAKEWYYEENDELGIKPNTVLPNSNFNVSWICSECGGKYKTYIGNRTKGTGCPYCAGQKILVGVNDLASTRPDLLKEWDYEKNGKIGITPNNVMRGTHIVANWICPVGHEYKKEIKIRTSGQGCPICAQESQTSFPEQAIYYYLAKVFDDVKNRYGNPEIDIYIPSLKFGIEYDGMFAHKNKENKDKQKDIILQQKGINLLRIKEVKKIINKDIENTIYCIPNNYLHMQNVLEKIIDYINTKYNMKLDINIDIEKDRITIEELYINSLKQNSIKDKYPNIVKEWDYEKNGRLKPDFIPYGSSKKYWWKCGNHSYLATPKHRVHGTQCPICAGKKVLKGYNDLLSKNPLLASEWDYEKNISIKPDEVTCGSGKKVWWKCKKGHEWEATIRNRNKGTGCPKCYKNEKENLMKE